MATPNTIGDKAHVPTPTYNTDFKKVDSRSIYTRIERVAASDCLSILARVKHLVPNKNRIHIKHFWIFS